ncbi:hypothetical protein [Amycolatopsis sp. lyj-108]|uniref:hypothetical protein n=1 Tax=Amycolatopsis sp. lyj-108 TaxID=2789286 RepID=UPI00397A81E1
MPEPVLISIAAALAARGVVSLYSLVKDKFAHSPEAISVLEAAEGAAEDASEILDLAAVIEGVEGEDPEFRDRLREEWTRVSVKQHADAGGVNNLVNGQVTGKVVQARDIHGNISF